MSIFDLCHFGSVAGQGGPFVGFNLSGLPKTADPSVNDCAHVQIWVYVEKVDAIFERVVSHGCETIHSPQDQFWGERIFRMYDVNGFELVFSQTIEHLDMEEIRHRHKAQLKSPAGE